VSLGGEDRSHRGAQFSESDDRDIHGSPRFGPETPFALALSAH
jgi:hypothetical protein